MAAEYDFFDTDNLIGNKEKNLYPRIIIKNTINAETFIERLSHRTTFTASEVKGVLSLAAESIAELLGEGYRVELEGVGYFTPALDPHPIKYKAEIRGVSLQIDHVNFRAGKKLKDHLKSVPIVKSKNGFNKSSKQYSMEERKAMLETFLSENGIITRTEYSHMTGLLKNKALNELNTWAKEGFLTTRGIKSTKMYMKKQSE